MWEFRRAMFETSPKAAKPINPYIAIRTVLIGFFLTGCGGTVAFPSPTDVFGSRSRGTFCSSCMPLSYLLRSLHRLPEIHALFANRQVPALNTLRNCIQPVSKI